jgi:hypothetical protein
MEAENKDVLCVYRHWIYMGVPYSSTRLVGPAIEAFGYERILFGSSGASQTNAGAWYDIARESFAEMNTEQEVMDAVFANNAIKVYSSSG